MTREETKEAIKVMQAYVDGKEIEVKTHNHYYDVKPIWNWEDDVKIFRIKPELKLRPYKNMEECVNAMREHDGWLFNKDDGYATKPVYVDNRGLDIIGGGGPDDEYGHEGVTFDKLLERFTWIDGAACGVMEE